MLCQCHGVRELHDMLPGKRAARPGAAEGGPAHAEAGAGLLTLTCCSQAPSTAAWVEFVQLQTPNCAATASRKLLLNLPARIYIIDLCSLQCRGACGWYMYRQKPQ